MDTWRPYIHIISTTNTQFYTPKCKIWQPLTTALALALALALTLLWANSANRANTLLYNILFARVRTSLDSISKLALASFKIKNKNPSKLNLTFVQKKNTIQYQSQWIVTQCFDDTDTLLYSSYTVSDLYFLINEVLFSTVTGRKHPRGLSLNSIIPKH